ncbi:MAG: hypothetical protein KatS3mg132_002 [Limisphaera sp.]|nr:MAG: hypothetical protein KatS3mg132_002 [Limisphaera sp.]
MGTPVSSGNRGVMALGTSLVSLCAEAGAGGDRDVPRPSRGRRRSPLRVGSESRRVRVVNYRLSPRAKPCGAPGSWIVLASGLYRMLPLAAGPADG